MQPISSSAQPASRHCRPIKPFLSKDSSAGATPCPICRNTSRRETAPCSNRNSRSSIWRVAVGLTAHGGSQRSTHSSLAAASSRGPSNSAPPRIHASPSAAKTSTGSLGKSFSSRICALPCASIVRRRICVTRSPAGSTIARICPGVTAWRKASWRTISMCPDGSKGSFSRGQSMGRAVTPSGRGEPSPRTTPIRNIPLPSGTGTLKPGHHANPASHSGTA